MKYKISDLKLTQKHDPLIARSLADFGEASYCYCLLLTAYCSRLRYHVQIAKSIADGD